MSTENDDFTVTVTDAGDGMFEVKASWLETSELIDRAEAAEARKNELLAAKLTEAAPPSPAPEPVACAQVARPLTGDKLKKWLGRGGFLLVGDGSHVIEAFEPIPVRSREFDNFGHGQVTLKSEFALSSIGFARGQRIAGFGLAKKPDGPIVAYCEIPGGLTLQPGSVAKFPRGSVVF